MKKITILSLFVSTGLIALIALNLGEKNKDQESSKEITIQPMKRKAKKKKKTLEERRLFAIERAQFEFDLAKNPNTGEISREDRTNELEAALEIQSNNQNRTSDNNYFSRGPSNLGGRTRALAVDMSFASGNTLIAGGVSSGVYRSTDDGASWTRTSSNNDIHNVTAIAQDPRPGFRNIWYYGTGELAGNSATLGSFFLGQGVYQSTNGGLSWTVIPGTSSTFENFNSDFDIVHALAVSPSNGDLYIATINSIQRYDGTSFTEVLTNGGQAFTDVAIDDSGRVYATIGGNTGANGVYLSEDDGDTFTRIAQNGNPTGWGSVGRTVIATAPSNDNYLYALYANGANSGANQIEADLWRYDRSTDTWTDFSSTLPDLPGGPIGGIDPFAIQGGYDIDISVNPSNENYVAIAGTSVYRIMDIENDPEFELIGGYNGAQVALYDTPNGDTHHPDVHTLVFDPFDPNVFYTGTDGGVHRTDDINAAQVDWVNLNNNYQTYQYYDVALEPLDGSFFVLGGAQDNGTTAGGSNVGLPDNTTMASVAGGDGVSVGIGDRIGGNLQFYFGFQSGPAFRNNGGGSITPAGSPGSLFVTLFHLDEDNTNTLYYAGQNQLFRTNNAPGVVAGTWDELGVIPTGQVLRSFATTRGEYNPDTSYLLIGGQNGGVFRLDDPQNATALSEAVIITPNGASTAGGSIVSAMAIHPTNPDIAMVVYANFGIPSIFITEDATSDDPTWTNVERNLAPFSIRSAQVLEVDGQTQYYVGTARGLYSNEDPLTLDWAPEGVSQFGIPVVSTLEYRPSDNNLLIGTHGNGMYQSELTLLATDDVSDSVAQNDLVVFPNPVSEELNFQIRGTSGVTISSFEIIDATGRVIRRENIDNSSQSNVNVSSLNTGIYFLRVGTLNNQTVVKRFLKR